MRERRRARDRDDEDEVIEEMEAPAASWVDALQAQFGSVPWWVISAVVHAVVLLLTTLIVVAYVRPPGTEQIIPMEHVPPLPPNEEELEPLESFSDVNVDCDLPAVDHHPIFAHEEMEISDHVETANNMEDNSARGQEDAISDIPLGGTGVVGNLGVGGGGAGCYGTGSGGSGRFGFRAGAARKRAVVKHGGTELSEAGVDDALRWLARNQEPDGHWAVNRWGGVRHEDCHVGVTGLAVLAFLGAGHTENAGKYKNVVRSAIAFLISRQDGNGCIGTTQGPVSDHGAGYNQSISGLALAEAFGMARIARTGQAAQKAIDYSINVHQNPYGGWRYQARIPPDTSVSGWFIMQLKSAKVAGLKVDGKGFQGALAWLDSITQKPDPNAGTAVQYEVGKACYQPGKPYTPSMTSVAMLGYQFLGFKRTDPALIGGANYLAQNLPVWGQGQGTPSGHPVPFYYWYYGTLVMFQMGADWWKQWNEALRDMLIRTQIKAPGNPAVDGSWDPIGWDGQQAGRAYSTAMGCLCLEVYWRYFSATRD